MRQRGTRPSLAQRRDLRPDPRGGVEPAADRAGPAGPAGPGGMRRRGGGGGDGALSLMQRPCTLAAGLRRRLAPSGGETRFLQAIYSFSSSVSFITQKALHARCGLTAHACPVRRGRQAGSPPLNQSIRGSDAEALLAQGGTGRALEPAIRPSPSMIQSLLPCAPSLPDSSNRSSLPPSLPPAFPFSQLLSLSFISSLPPSTTLHCSYSPYLPSSLLPSVRPPAPSFLPPSIPAFLPFTLCLLP